MAPVGRIAELWRYPVKSMGGERVDAAEVGVRGLRGDRLWAVRDSKRGVTTNARRFPPLLECGARFAAEPPSGSGPGNACEVIVTFPDGSELSSSDPAMQLRLSDLVGKAVELTPLPPVDAKQQYRAEAANKADMRADLGVPENEPLPDLSMFPLKKLAELARYATPVGSFVDAYPVHVITRASLGAMAERTPAADFDVRRFRPNVVVETGAAPGLPEFDWCGGHLRSPGAALRVEIPTIRCVMPTRAQSGLDADPDVLRTVAAHAERCLGVYAEVERSGRLAVGDEVQFVPPAEPGAVAAFVKARGTALKRRLVRAGNSALPRG